MKKVMRRLKRLFIPHRGNKYRPEVLAKQSIAVIAALLLLAEGAYLVQSKIVLDNTGFLASVLPAALTELTNADRAAAGIEGLVADAKLARAAQAKAEDMASNSYFAHVSPDGKGLRDWLTSVGYEYTYAGENLAVDFSESADIEEAWMNSPTHRANLLKQEYTRVGYGVARGMYEGREVTFVAQYFAAQRGDGTRVAVSEVAPQPETAEPAQPTRVLAESAVAAEPDVQETGPQYIEAPAADSSPSGKAAVLSTSPSRVIGWIIMAVTAFIAVFFTIAVFSGLRMRVWHTEAVVGCAVLVGLLASLMLYNNGTHETHAAVPEASQAASVSAVF
jgi:uncharacterized protein YkwD